jgi:hypothetical protein
MGKKVKLNLWIIHSGLFFGAKILKLFSIKLAIFITWGIFLNHNLVNSRTYPFIPFWLEFVATTPFNVVATHSNQKNDKAIYKLPSKLSNIFFKYLILVISMITYS